MNYRQAVIWFGCLILGAVITVPRWRTSAQSEPSAKFSPSIPQTWDDLAMAQLEVPLANPIGSPKHAPGSYYYSIPVRPIYKSYPVYAPGHEPPGYIDWLKQQEPVILWDDKDHAPPLKTEADWVRAGEIVFDAPAAFGALYPGIPKDDLYVRQPDFYQKTKMPVAADGTVPFYRYVVKEKGEVLIGVLACGMCHTRIMPDGAILKGAQGSFPFDRVYAYNIHHSSLPVETLRLSERFLFAVPWLRTDVVPDLDHLSINDITAFHEAIPPGLVARHGTSPLYPAQVPDLIGLKDRHYFDRTGLQQHRSIVDVMRYSALNQGGDFVSNYDGFIPAGFPDFKKPPDPNSAGGRYSDAQLYALALYVYSLQPPPNPNKPDALSKQGEEVFKRENCPVCHTPPLYTSNKLTIAEGFTPPPDADEKYDILPVSVGTDPNLALKTRRGTGYYKVPSLKGVWYRSMFGHSGWCATLEDWFDPRRLRDDYVPTGFMPYGVKSYAVKGHRFGLKLSEEDRKALIAFLKTL